MNKRIGGGMNRSTSDPTHVAKVLEFRAKCGVVDEEVRVEELTKAQHLKLVADRARAAAEEVQVEMEALREKYAVAFDTWLTAQKAWLDANDEETK